jgi:hypothetical protein
MARRTTSTAGPAGLADLRSAIGRLVESDRIDAWVTGLPDEALIQFMAPLEMLSFQYYLDPPPHHRHLVKAARVTCESMHAVLDRCPPDLADALCRIDTELGRHPA